MFLGFRHQDGDFLYGEEWSTFSSWLSVHVAFSRDHEDKKAGSTLTTSFSFQHVNAVGPSDVQQFRDFQTGLCARHDWRTWATCVQVAGCLAARRIFSEKACLHFWSNILVTWILGVLYMKHSRRIFGCFVKNIELWRDRLCRLVVFWSYSLLLSKRSRQTKYSANQLTVKLETLDGTERLIRMLVQWSLYADVRTRCHRKSSILSWKSWSWTAWQKMLRQTGCVPCNEAWW